MEDAGVEVQTDFIRGAQGIQGDKGEQGEKGDKGDKGDKGEAFTYNDLTPEQIEELRQQLYEGLITQDEMDIILVGIDTNLNTMQDNIEAEMGTKVSQNLETYTGDLNDVKTTGFIYADGTATNTPLKGYSFYVTVISLNNQYIIQKANRVSATYFEEYERQCVSGTWTEWVQVMGVRQPTNVGVAFNEMKTTGNYFFTARPTGENKPIDVSGLLEVFAIGNFITQRYTTYEGQTVYTRGYYNGTWSQWKNW